MRLYRWLSIVLICLCMQACTYTRMSQEMSLGKVYFSDGNFKKAFRQLLPVAIYGKPEAQYAVGYMYYYGYGPARDPESGIFWMNRAASCGYAPAIKALGLIERGVPECPTDLRVKGVCIDKSFKGDGFVDARDEIVETIVEKRREVPLGPRVITQPQTIIEPVIQPRTIVQPPVIRQPIIRPSVVVSPQAKIQPSTIVQPQTIKQPVVRSSVVRPQAKIQSRTIVKPLASKQSVVRSSVIVSPQTKIQSRTTVKPLAIKKPIIRSSFVVRPQAKFQPKTSKRSIPSAKPSLSAKKFGLQIFGAFNLANVKKVQKELGLGKKSQIWHTKNAGKDWFVLTVGKFSSASEARSAIDTELKDLDPWVRKLDGLKASV